MNQTYSLNMIPGGNPLRVPVRQFDKGSRTITMTLWNGSGAFSVPAGSAVTVEGTKPDGKSFSSTASFSGTGVSFTVTEQMAAVAGDVRCQLPVTKSGTILGSATFLLVVEPSALPENPDLSETVFSSFQQLKNAAHPLGRNAAGTVIPAGQGTQRRGYLAKSFRLNSREPTTVSLYVQLVHQGRFINLHYQPPLSLCAPHGASSGPEGPFDQLFTDLPVSYEPEGYTPPEVNV